MDTAQSSLSVYFLLISLLSVIVQGQSATGPKGEKGDPGPPGQSGPVGPTGPVGRPGLGGIPGQKGRLGIPGEPGRDGLPGLNGDMGADGLPGISGEPGYPGVDGLPGIKGESCSSVPGSGSTTSSSGFMFTKHSQTDIVPQCPAGTRMWDGYSFLYVDGNAKSKSRDLGSSGSCLQRFSTMPFMFCNFDSVCNYARKNDASFWLSTASTKTLGAVSEQDIRPYVSRCVVCDVPTNVMAIHSQSREVPDCPVGWTGLWNGYSYAMRATAGAEGGGQSLASPDSCLEEFVPRPFIECDGARGFCRRFSNRVSFWLAAIDASAQFRTPVSEAVKPVDLRSRISRCQVCKKDSPVQC